jgi:two-component system chemotaxis response regulator CheY
MSIQVLVVDDEPTLCNLMNEILKHGGYRVVSVANGQECVTRLQTDPDFGLVITDLLMPKMDGLALLESVKQCYPTIPVILSSAIRDTAIVLQLREQGMAGFLPRPFTPKQLLALVQQVLNR